MLYFSRICIYSCTLGSLLHVCIERGIVLTLVYILERRTGWVFWLFTFWWAICLQTISEDQRWFAFIFFSSQCNLNKGFLSRNILNKCKFLAVFFTQLLTLIKPKHENMKYALLCRSFIKAWCTWKKERTVWPIPSCFVLFTTFCLNWLVNLLLLALFNSCTHANKTNRKAHKCNTYQI